MLDPALLAQARALLALVLLARAPQALALLDPVPQAQALQAPVALKSRKANPALPALHPGQAPKPIAAQAPQPATSSQLVQVATVKQVLVREGEVASAQTGGGATAQAGGISARTGGSGISVGGGGMGAGMGGVSMGNGGTGGVATANAGGGGSGMAGCSLDGVMHRDDGNNAMMSC